MVSAQGGLPMSARLSAAMIVRDEAALLPECLEGLRGLADEIVVVDTGSTDETAQIAAAAGCRVLMQPWTGDFSAARNAALRACTGAWIFVVDADERIAAEDVPALRALATGPLDRAWRITTRNYTHAAHLDGFTACAPEDPMARGFAGWTPSVKVRLFPNVAEARFEGVVHELVNASLERTGIVLCDAAIPVHHYPLLHSEARQRAKQALYLALGHAKAAAQPENPHAQAELGNQLVEVGDFAGAVRAYRDAVRLQPENARYLKELGTVLYLAGRPAEAEQALRLAAARDAGIAEVWRNLGVVLARQERWAEALPCFREAARLRPENADHARYLALAMEAAGGAHAGSRQESREAQGSGAGAPPQNE
jgi:tetratricopeptide (TPR) repeat protein